MYLATEVDHLIWDNLVYMHVKYLLWMYTTFSPPSRNKTSKKLLFIVASGDNVGAVTLFFFLSKSGHFAYFPTFVCIGVVPVWSWLSLSHSLSLYPSLSLSLTIEDRSAVFIDCGGGGKGGRRGSQELDCSAMKFNWFPNRPVRLCNILLIVPHWQLTGRQFL